MAGNAPKIRFANTVTKQPFYKNLEPLEVPYGPASDTFEVSPLKENRTPAFANRPWNRIPTRSRSVKKYTPKQIANIQRVKPNWEPTVHSANNAYLRATALHANVYPNNGANWNYENEELNTLANEGFLGSPASKRAKTNKTNRRRKSRTHRKSRKGRS